MKNIFLSGGGNAKDSRNLDIRFLESLASKKILYIPIALEGNKKHPYNECLKWISATLSKASGGEKIIIEMLTNLDNVNIDYLKTFDAVYIGGGNTFNLLQRIKENKFDSILKKYISGGGSIYGGSAGAIIFGKSIETVGEENEHNYKNSDGLNLLDGVSVRCHFGDTDEEIKKIVKFMKDFKSDVIALPKNSGLIIKNSSVEVVGPPIYFFSQGRFPFDLVEGKIISIKRSNDVS